MLTDKTILITGGTGSFGRKFTRTIFERYSPKKVIIYSRDEFKQHEMAKSLRESRFPVRYFIGDVRDKGRFERALDGVDYVVHAAALKQVPALEYNPMEAVKTNILGAHNVVEAALNRSVKKVIALSTDKAVNPVNLYGATKLVAEKIFIDANAYGGNKTKFSVVRYGNVVASRGSVIEHFMDLKKRGVKEFPITDESMTRFWMTLEQSAELVLRALGEAEGGEIFVPGIPSMNIVDLARAVEPGCVIKRIGVRPGEKVHETLISEDESRKARTLEGLFVILPQFFERREARAKYKDAGTLPEGFVYRSDKNERWLSVDDLKRMLPALKNEEYADEGDTVCQAGSR